MRAGYRRDNNRRRTRTVKKKVRGLKQQDSASFMTHHHRLRRAAILSAVAVTTAVACGPLLAQNRVPTAVTGAPKRTLQPYITRFTYTLARLSLPPYGA